MNININTKSSYLSFIEDSMGFHYVEACDYEEEPHQHLIALESADFFAIVKAVEKFVDDDFNRRMALIEQAECLLESASGSRFIGDHTNNRLDLLARAGLDQNLTATVLRIAAEYQAACIGAEISLPSRNASKARSL